MKYAGGKARGPGLYIGVTVLLVILFCIMVVIPHFTSALFLSDAACVGETKFIKKQCEYS